MTRISTGAFKSLILALAFLATLNASALDVNYEASVTGQAASGDFAPFYISSLSWGRYASRYAAISEAKAWKPLDLSTRFSYSFGLDLAAGYHNAVDYQHYNNSSHQWGIQSIRPASAWVQQLYGEVKYRGAFLTVGMKEHSSPLLNQQLTSGDFIQSGNARPIPEARAGFVDFQDVPFTQGWLQIQGELSFGKLMDNDWRENHFNMYNGHYGQNEWYNYKRVYFRVGTPSNRWTITAGMQASAMFAGKTFVYEKGQLKGVNNHDVKFKNILKIWLPLSGGDDFYEGNHLGSWDFRADVKLDNGTCLSAYFEWPWEDGSGIGKLNGWDGIWGLEYKASRQSWIDGAVVEFLDFTNQSGPIHYAPGDYPGTTLTGQATGADNYYNNNSYDSYCYYGQSLGTPAIMAPIYNLDGVPLFVANRMRGFHVAVEGHILPALSYRLKGGYRKGYGNGRYTLPNPIDLGAFMVEAKYDLRQVHGLSLKAMVELDRGSMPCNNFGALLTLSYHGLLQLKK